MTEAEERQAIVKEALTWVGTPFFYGACVKGPKGGVDCGRFPAAVLKAAGVLPNLDLAKLPKLPAKWFLHCSKEMLGPMIAQYAKEYRVAHPGAPAQPAQAATLEAKVMPEPGDIVAAKYGKDLAHCAIVVAWPKVVAAACESVVCVWQNIFTSPQYMHRPLRFFDPLQK